MKTTYVMIAACFAFTFLSCKNETKQNETPETKTEKRTEQLSRAKKQAAEIIIEMEPKSNTQAYGKAAFTESDGVVTLHAKFAGLTPGVHAIHIHEKSDCSADDAMSTGGHWNPTFEQHGKWGDTEGYHRGDIGNFKVGDDGSGHIEFKTDQWCIGCGDEKKDIIGKALIVHEAADDFVTQPTGDAGGRVSCGAIIK